jgi:multiple sugar transport system substrate-binding protein
MRGRSGSSLLLAVIGTFALVVGVAGCGGDDGGGGPQAQSGKLEGKGPITWATGKDTSGYIKSALDKWNKDHPDEKVELIELPEAADAQRQQLIQNAQTKSDAYSIVSTDVVWTAEFAANGWIEELPENELSTDKMLQPAVETAKYFNKLYAAPWRTNGGLLFYRKDLLDAAGITTAPKTWDEMKQACQKVQAKNAGIGCFAGQFEKYEGLTVNFSEAVQSAGGAVVDDKGKPTLNTPEAKQGLDFLVEGVKSGMIPRDAITYKEEEGRRAFQEGKLIFHRQWPYQFALANATDGSSKVAGKFAVAPLPGLSGPGKSSLGGLNLAISKFGKNKGSALAFIKFITSEAEEKVQLEKTSEAPVYTALYDDPSLQQKFPYLPMLKASVENAVARPRVVKYGDTTLAIQEEAYAAITGKKAPDQALKDLQSKLESITGK